MKAGIRTAAAAALTALALGALGGSASAGDAGQAKVAKRGECKVTLALARSTYASYVSAVKVKHTSCKKAWKVIRAYHDCRKANGGRNGHCKSRVKGYKCKEGKRTGVPNVSYDADVVCKKGAKTIKHHYRMNL